MQHDISSKAGFVAVVGRPNAGKSTLINSLVEEKVAMVSHKANATRKRQLIILMHQNAQIVLVDTPGLHENEKELNKFMQKEAISAINESDLVLFLADMSDSTANYAKFLEIFGNKPHIVALTKMDNFNHQKRLEKLSEYQKYADRFISIIPVSAKKSDYESLISELAKSLPNHPYYFDPEDLTTANLKEIYREMIREALFENLSDEIPYESDVMIASFKEKKNLFVVEAKIIIEKESQKAIVIGKAGSAIKRIGKSAREKMESFSQMKVFLDLVVEVVPNWSKDKKKLKKLGYETGD